MRTILLATATLVALAALAVPAGAQAPELPPIADLAPGVALPAAPAPTAPSVPDPAGFAPASVPDPLASDAVPVPVAPAEVGELLPEPTEPAARSPFLPGTLPLPPPEHVVAGAAIGSGLALVGFALYSRLSRAEILDHERRDAVFQLVRAQPGITLTDIASRTGLGWGTAVYHLDRLERAGFLTSERAAGRRCYFPVGTVPREARPMIGALQQETTRSVAQFVAERPGATQTELCEGLGLSASAASKQVTKLESAGLLRREREWKTVRLHPEPQLAQMLAPALAA